MTSEETQEIRDLLQQKEEREQKINEFLEKKTFAYNIHRKSLSNINYDYYIDKFERDKELKHQCIMLESNGEDTIELKKQYNAREHILSEQMKTKQEKIMDQINTDIEIINLQAEQVGIDLSKLGVAI